MGRVLVLGSLNVDLVTSGRAAPAPWRNPYSERDLRRLAGGKGANQAVAAAAAGAHGGDGRVRRRRRGRARLSGTSLAWPGEASTCPGCVTVAGPAHGHRPHRGQTTTGENSIIVIPGANAALDDSEVEAVDDLGPGDVLLLQLEVPLRAVCAAARRAAGSRCPRGPQHRPVCRSARRRRGPRGPAGRQRARGRRTRRVRAGARRPCSSPMEPMAPSWNGRTSVGAGRAVP
jgi:hypothetical protein